MNFCPTHHLLHDVIVCLVYENVTNQNFNNTNHLLHCKQHSTNHSSLPNNDHFPTNIPTTDVTTMLTAFQLTSQQHSKNKKFIVACHVYHTTIYIIVWLLFLCYSYCFIVGFIGFLLFRSGEKLWKSP